MGCAPRRIFIGEASIYGGQGSKSLDFRIAPKATGYVMGHKRTRIGAGWKPSADAPGRLGRRLLEGFLRCLVSAIEIGAGFLQRTHEDGP
jgi:hypothetical protein